MPWYPMPWIIRGYTSKCIMDYKGIHAHKNENQEFLSDFNLNFKLLFHVGGKNKKR